MMNAPAMNHSWIRAWDAEADDHLTCVAVFAETHDVKTFVFAAAEGRRFEFLPGQFLTFEFEIRGDIVRRCYSLASSPLRPFTASITVKRVSGGVVSEWLHQNLNTGMTVRALGPMGSFSTAHHPAAKYLFVSGGSGITPLMSMSRDFADRACPADIVFLHAARTPADVIFRDELALISRRLKGFRVTHLPEDRIGEPEWAGMTGRLNNTLLGVLVPDIIERTVFCCGPEPFMRVVQLACSDLGVAPSRYHHESFDFGVLKREEPEFAADRTDADVKTYSVTFAKSRRTISVRADETVLKAAKAAGIKLPSSCATGLCGTCKSKRISGNVDMSHRGGIRQREIDAGFFLPCCSKPTSDLVFDR
jgi:glycine betaine catabolism B